MEIQEQDTQAQRSCQRVGLVPMGSCICLAGYLRGLPVLIAMKCGRIFLLPSFLFLFLFVFPSPHPLLVFLPFLPLLSCSAAYSSSCFFFSSFEIHQEFQSCFFAFITQYSFSLDLFTYLFVYFLFISFTKKRYDPMTNVWRFVNDSTTNRPIWPNPLVIGGKGYPSARYGSAYAVGKDGRFWMFGGKGKFCFWGTIF